jgi:hypothetical protein
MLALFLALVSCSQHAGDFALLASRAVDFDSLDRSYEMSRERTTGRACFSSFKVLFGLPDDAVVRATREAMEQVPGADALILVELHDHGRCVEVSGFPARFQ